MRTFWPPGMRAESIPFDERVACSESILEKVEAANRILLGPRDEESEVQLATCLVELRNLVVAVRSNYGLFDAGPQVQVDGVLQGAFECFSKACRNAATWYLRIQELRFERRDWNEICEDARELFSQCISSVDEFFAIAHAVQNQTTLEVAKRLLQLKRDSLRSGIAISEDQEIGSKETEVPSITAEELEQMFDLKSKRIRELMTEGRVEVVVKAAGRRPNRYAEKAAIEYLDARKTRRRQ